MSSEKACVSMNHCNCNNCDTLPPSPPEHVTIRVNTLTPKKKEKKENKENKEKKEKKEEKDRCAICIDVVGNQLSKTACGHTFCLTCLHEHLKTNHLCPLCRANILDEQPKKPINEVSLEKTIDIINEEIEQWDVNRMMELCKAFPQSAKKRIRVDMEEFAYEIAKKFRHYQFYDSDDEYDIEYDSEDERDEQDSYS